MVFGVPGDIETDFVGEPHHRGGVIDDLAWRHRLIALRHQIEQAEFHPLPLMRRYIRRSR
jgi:hypothetical protein